MLPHRFPRPHCADTPPPPSDADFRPFEKLVIGLPSAMVSWGRAYGPATEWIATPPNPLDTSAPHRGGDADSRRRGDAAGGPSTATPEASADGPSGDLSGRGTATCAAASPAPTSITTTTRPFRCEPCDRTFAVEAKYKEHVQSHIHCTVPGCNFTCRENRAFMMQEHMDCLHNRPDAPNLADTGAYLDQRKRRFPTQDVIQGRLEELYYKAARGVVLPDERRRWMKQYGIDVGKRPRTEASYIARGGLPRTSRSPSPPSPSAGLDPTTPTPPPTGERAHSAAAAAPPRFIQPPASAAGAATAGEAVMDPTAPPAVSAPCSQPPPPIAPAAMAATASPTAVPAAAAKAPGPRPIKMIPLGPNGTLTPRQRVQLVRERYARAEEVPQFYVCSRCGSKGEHWVDECPTKGDATYNRRVVWGEARMVLEEGKAKVGQRERRDDRGGGGQGTSGEQGEGEAEDKGAATEPTAVRTHDEAPQAAPATEAPLVDTQHDPTAMTDITSKHRSNGDSSNNEEDDDDDAPPPSQSAAAPAGAPREVTRGMAPVAAARYAQPNLRHPPRRPPLPPTLYERLTEEERMNEQGLLLQAMRFFVARDFFKVKR